MVNIKQEICFTPLSGQLFLKKCSCIKNCSFFGGGEGGGLNLNGNISKHS